VLPVFRQEQAVLAVYLGRIRVVRAASTAQQLSAIALRVIRVLYVLHANKLLLFTQLQIVVAIQVSIWLQENVIFVLLLFRDVPLVLVPPPAQLAQVHSV